MDIDILLENICLVLAGIFLSRILSFLRNVPKELKRIADALTKDGENNAAD